MTTPSRATVFSNYSGIFLVPLAAAGEEKGKEASPESPQAFLPSRSGLGTQSPGTPCWVVTSKYSIHKKRSRFMVPAFSLRASTPHKFFSIGDSLSFAGSQSE